jgi:hypothetical protein
MVILPKDQNCELVSALASWATWHRYIPSVALRHEREPSSSFIHITFLSRKETFRLRDEAMF